MKPNLMVLKENDNVGVAVLEIKAGELIRAPGVKLEARQDIPRNHKAALAVIPRNQPVIKHGEIIGYAAETISPGEWVHTHNLKTNEG